MTKQLSRKELKKIAPVTRECPERDDKDDGDAFLHELGEKGALIIDERDFDPCKGSGIQIQPQQLLDCVRKRQANLTSELMVDKIINKFSLVIRIGPNGNATTPAGGTVALISPNTSNCLVLLFAGNGANGAAATVPTFSSGLSGADGGQGGRCRVVVNKCNTILAFAGDGGNGGNGQGLPGNNLIGGSGGDASSGGDVTLVCQGNNSVSLQAGAGGNGGAGAQGGAAVPSTGNGGNGGHGARGGSVKISALASDRGVAISGTGGDGAAGGSGNATARGTAASGGDGGDGGNAGSVLGAAGTGIRCTLGAPGGGSRDGFPAPNNLLAAFFAAIFGGDNGQKGTCA